MSISLLKEKSFLKISDFTKEELEGLITLSSQLKKEKSVRNWVSSIKR